MIQFDKFQLTPTEELPTSPWNLINGTADFSGEWNNSGYWKDDNWVSPNGNKSRFMKDTSWMGLSKTTYALYSNQKYTFSAYVWLSNDVKSDVCFYGTYADDSNKLNINNNGKHCWKAESDPKNQWVRIFATFIPKDHHPTKLRFELTSPHGEFHIADIMLNKGSVPLDWNYSLNDIRKKFGGVAKALYRLATARKAVA